MVLNDLGTRASVTSMNQNPLGKTQKQNNQIKE